MALLGLAFAIAVGFVVAALLIVATAVMTDSAPTPRSWYPAPGEEDEDLPDVF